MKNNYGRLLMAALIGLSAASCQKEIHIDLNESNPRYVIEAEITDGPQKGYVWISKTLNFDQSNQFPSVDDAEVTITDLDDNVSEALTWKGEGRYELQQLKGKTGHTYELKVNVGEHRFRSVCQIPAQAVELDTIYFRKSDFGGTEHFPVPVFTDPPGKGNHYMLRLFVNGAQVAGSRTRSDEGIDGQRSDFPFYYDVSENSKNPTINNGDMVKIQLMCIDAAVYEFYRTLRDVIDQNSASPANPRSNIDGGAIGVFNAATLRDKTVRAVL